MTDTTSVGAPIELPVLDISNPLDPNAGKAMLDAATTYGFLYVDSKGTDFTPADVKRAFELSQTFFKSPAEEKATCRIEPNVRLRPLTHPSPKRPSPLMIPSRTGAGPECTWRPWTRNISEPSRQLTSQLTSPDRRLQRVSQPLPLLPSSSAHKRANRAFNFGEFINNQAQQPLPPALAPHEAEIAHFAELCQKTCARVLTLLALGLG
ncbi:2-oxoglutarate and iron-dependent oxygenase domain-containing protein, partial [Aspergillus brunneoviolaceus CBS 621.78]